MATATEPPRLSLRQRKHAATIAEIKEVALRQMAADSAASLSLRAVARELGTSVQALYHYYPGRDALITDLVADTHEDFVASLERVAARAADRTPQERLADVSLAYRRWACENRARFLLIYGDPIPGYAAPEDGPTVAPAQRLGTLFAQLIFDGWPAPVAAADRALEPRLQQTLAAAGRVLAPGLSAARAALLFQSWARLHGLVLLELNGHLPWMRPAGLAEEFVRGAVASIWVDLQARRGQI